MPKIRVLVVDDAVVIRRMITDVLSRDPQIEVVGTAANGKIALQKIPQVNPDILTLDVEMPEMNGLETLKELRKIYPTLPVIMFSTLTDRGAVTTIEALSLGASDYVAKPANVGGINEGIRKLEAELVPKVKSLAQVASAPEPGPGDVVKRGATSSGNPIRSRSPRDHVKVPIDILAIGCSTGGPNALADVFKGILPAFPIPIVLVQHMPPLFTALLAERLSAHTPIRFVEGQEGQLVEPGCGYIAPGGKHMEVRRKSALTSSLILHEGPPENSCRPAVDVLFRSVAESYGPAVLGVVLTGMGQDGLRGCEHICERGGRVLCQDEETSVVWGMPGAVATAGLVEEIVPLNKIAMRIQSIVVASRQSAGRPESPSSRSASYAA